MKKYVRMAGSLTLLGLLAWKVDFAEVGGALVRVGWAWWSAALGIYIAAQVVSSVRWQALARPVGFNESLVRYTAYYFVGNFFNMLLPTSVGGDVARAWYLDAGGGRRWLAFLTVLADRLNGLFILVALACVAAMVVPLPGWVIAWTAAAGLCAIAGFVLLVWLGCKSDPSRPMAETARESGGSTPPPGPLPEAGRGGTSYLLPLPVSGRGPGRGVETRRVRKLLGELSEVSRLYGRSPRLIAGVTALSVVVQVANVILVWLLALALEVHVSLEYCFVFVPLVTLLTLAPVSLNGMGVREGGSVLLLAPVGVPAEQAVTLSLLWFSVFTMAGLAGAGFYLLGRFPRYEVPSDAESVGDHSDQGRARQPQAAA